MWRLRNAQVPCKTICNRGKSHTWGGHARQMARMQRIAYSGLKAHVKFEASSSLPFYRCATHISLEYWCARNKCARETGKAPDYQDAG